MLILKLDVGEKLYINGNEVDVLIMGINGNQTRFGINAPKNMRVDREEIRKRITDEAKCLTSQLQHVYATQK